MISRVRDTIVRHGMLRGVSGLGVAVSGGADSVCLLHVLHDLAPEFGLSLLVLHLNHGLRGEESDADAEWVAGLAGSLGLRAIVERVDVAALGDNLEQAGRNARRAFFARLRAEGVVERVATAHTRSDQAETVIYRLLRGSGLTGLRGILPVTAEGMVRPLLDCSRAEVEAFLTERGISWREDRSNTSPLFVRNRIRSQLLPLIAREFNPAVSEVLAATAEVARDEEEWWERRTEDLASRMFRRTAEGIVLRADEVVRLHPAEARRVLRRAIRETKGDLRGIEIPHVERIRELAAQPEGHGRMQAPGLDVFRSFEWLRIGRPRTKSRFEGDYAIPVDPHPNGAPVGFQIGETAIFLETGRLDPQSAYNEGTDELDAGLLRGPLELRNWRPGDDFEPAGRSRTKIKTLFQEGRVPIWERHGWPVLVSGSEIVWTRRFGVTSRLLPGARTGEVLRVYEKQRVAAVSPGGGDSAAQVDESRESKKPDGASNY